MLRLTLWNRGNSRVSLYGRMVAGEDARTLWGRRPPRSWEMPRGARSRTSDAIDAAGLGLLIFLHTPASTAEWS